VWVLVLGFFMFIKAVFTSYSILDHRGRLGGLEQKVGSACEEFVNNEDNTHT